jgi:hypothetical protein
MHTSGPYFLPGWLGGVAVVSEGVGMDPAGEHLGLGECGEVGSRTTEDGHASLVLLQTGGERHAWPHKRFLSGIRRSEAVAAAAAVAASGLARGGSATAGLELARWRAIRTEKGRPATSCCGSPGP